MLPFFKKLSEKLKNSIPEKVLGLLVQIQYMDSKKKRALDDECTGSGGSELKKKKMDKTDDHEVGEVGLVEAVELDEKINDNNDSSTNSNETKDSNEDHLISSKEEPERSNFQESRTRNPYSTRSSPSPVLGSSTSKEIVWSEEQLESLTTALVAFRYSPRTTVHRVYREMRRAQNGNCSFMKEDVRNWLSQRCNYNSSQRLLTRKRKIEEIGEIEVSQSKKNPKITFSVKVKQKEFNTFEKTSAVEENHNIVYVSLKE